MKKTTIRNQMQQVLIADNSRIAAVVGIDLGDRKSWLCRLELDGQVSDDRSIKTTREALVREFEGKPRLRIVIEAGGQSNWIAQLLMRLGHEVIVANSRQLKLISASMSKSDRRDAWKLAELGLTSPNLLAATEPRSEQTLADRAELVSRDLLVKLRTDTIGSVRGQLKNFGYRVTKGSAETFAKRALPELPALLRSALEPLLRMIESLTEEIRKADKRILKLCETRYPSTQLMRQIKGVGPITSLAFALALDNKPERLKKSRDAGAFTGLKPKQRDSGESAPELHITKLGDPMLRRLLVQCAQYVLGHWGEDCDTRRWGLKLAGRGGKNAKKRAVVATARKLSVLMHVLWSRGEVYDPLYLANKTAA